MAANVFHKVLNGHIAPMVYIMMFMSVFIGFCFATGALIDPSQSILYGDGVLVDPRVWGAFLCVTSSTALYGMIGGRDRLIQFGGLWGFMLWLFAAVAVLLAGHLYIFVTVAGFHLAFHVYVVLASSLGYLRRAQTNE